MLRLPLLFTLWLLATAAGAAEGSAAAVEPATPAPSSEAATDEEEEGAPANEGAPSPDVFVPTEEISEDLSIAFPVDI